MILEVAILDVVEGFTDNFEKNFIEASKIISSQKGYCGHELQKCIENSNRYILLVRWDKIEDHTIGFRQSKKYLEWKELLHKFYDPFPKVEHFQLIYENT